MDATMSTVLAAVAVVSGVLWLLRRRSRLHKEMFD
jgi:uncharacterized protein (TIGR03382 family)